VTPEDIEAADLFDVHWYADFDRKQADELAKAFARHRHTATAEALEVLRWYANKANYKTFHDEDGDESIACDPCDLTPADEEGNRVYFYDCGDRARAAIAKIEGQQP